MIKPNRILVIAGITLLLAAISRAGSLAVTQIFSDRVTTAAAIVSDNEGILQLNGFNDRHILTSSFSTVGTISNNSTRSLHLRLNIDPHITLARENPSNKKIRWVLRLRLRKNESASWDYAFSGNGPSDPPHVWSDRLAIAPGETLNLEALMTTVHSGGYLFAADSSFIFNAAGTNGFQIDIADTAGTPRRHYYSSGR